MLATAIIPPKCIKKNNRPTENDGVTDMLNPP